MAFGKLGAMGRGMGHLGSLGRASTATLTPYYVLDTTNSVYQSNGTSYASEAAMNTALGITKSGEARTIPTTFTGSELVTNGTFGSDVSGWTAGQISGSGAAISWEATGKLQLDTNGASQAFARQTILLKQGVAYGIFANCGKVDATTAGVSAVGGSYQTTFQNAVGFTTKSGSYPQSVQCVTSCTTTSTTPSPSNIEPAEFPANVSFRLGSSLNSAETGGIYVFDNVSIKEAVCLPGALSKKLGCILTFTTPGTFASQTIIEFNVDGVSGSAARDRVRLALNSSGDLTYTATVQNLSAASQVLGTLSTSTQYTVWLTIGPDTFMVRLGSGGTLYKFNAASNNGLSIAGKTALNFIPSVGRMWIGRSFAGSDTFTGTIQRLRLFNAGLPSLTRPVISIGNSLAGIGAAGINNTSISTYYGVMGYWPQILGRALTKPSRAVCFSFGGGTATQIRDKWGDGNTSAQAIPTQWDTIANSLAPYASLDPVIIYNTAYNAINPAVDSAGAVSGATGEYNGTTVMHANILAAFPQFNKFILNGARWGTGVSDDVEWRSGGFKAAAATTLNGNFQTWAAANSVVWNDIQADLIDETKGLAWAGLTANAQDLTDIGRGQIPSQLRIDGIHQNGSGQLSDAESVRLKIVAAGWDTFSTTGTIFDLAA
jgi:hypothetical protein